MRLKQRPEDFEVTESWRFDEDPKGPWYVYLLDKQKVSTFEAVDRICARPTICAGDRFNGRNAFLTLACGVSSQLQAVQIGDEAVSVNAPARLSGVDKIFKALDGLLAAMLVVMLVMVRWTQFQPATK